MYVSTMQFWSPYSLKPSVLRLLGMWYVCMKVCMYVRKYACMCVCVCVCMHACILYIKRAEHAQFWSICNQNCIHDTTLPSFFGGVQRVFVCMCITMNILPEDVGHQLEKRVFLAACAPLYSSNVTQTHTHKHTHTRAHAYHAPSPWSTSSYCVFH